LDGSEIIIQKNKKTFETLNSHIFFKKFTLFEEDSKSAIRSFIDQRFSSPIFYSRFFLHVLDNTEIYEFFRFFSSFLDHSNAICIEYRTVLDQERQKVHAPHYRNYINPEKINLICREFGLYNDYYCEGVGYSKYKTEDAYVARHIIKLEA
jgi:tellurite methyltransferase